MFNPPVIAGGIECGNRKSKRSTAPLRLLLFRQGAKQS
jgi:hypothetical protein